MTNIDSGLNTWQLMTNHNKMIDLQKKLYDGEALPSGGPGRTRIFRQFCFSYYFARRYQCDVRPVAELSDAPWDWYFQRIFPRVPVDIGVSTHAHFDHDALHRLDAHVLIDRLIGTFTFGDVTIKGIADKHETDSEFGDL